ncbi:MAG: tetratricopeptide repeat protein [Candidatus Nanopelagicales bacterium]
MNDGTDSEASGEEGQPSQPDDHASAALPASDPIPVLRMPEGVLAPAGDAYDWYRRGSALLEQGNAAAAAELLAWAARAEPEAASIREAWARALFDARRFPDAEREFRVLVDLVPDDDYARFGLGLTLWRLRQFPEAAEHLAMASVMRPDRPEYARALGQVRATIAARAEAGMDPIGSPEEGLT